MKGENGFRLSLFGVDPAADHASILKEYAGRRANQANVDASLILLKPLGDVAHGGGRLIAAGSREHEIIRSWLAAGAKLDPLDQSQSNSSRLRPRSTLLRWVKSFNCASR